MRRLNLALILVLFAAPSVASDKRSDVLDQGRRLQDQRLEPLKDYDGFFPFNVPDSPEAWKRRAGQLRERMLVANGLWPLPEKMPLNAVVHGKTEQDGYTTEKVYFESLPGFFVTGTLFRPVGKTAPFPGVLCPHGHSGRLQDIGIKDVRMKITLGQERFEGSGRFSNIARSAQLARMGCVSFCYDMIGYADSLQIPFELVHRYAKPRPHMETKTGWGFFSAQAELRLQSVMGLQTWNSIRALDFLCSLPDVDPSRIGVTGGSGGGTQTILLCAIDPRPTVAFPQGMVSTAMQGGCTCENCSLLRIGTGNIELAGLFAPKPQAMTAADDWTKDMLTVGFPELKRLYAMLGAPENVACTDTLHFPHNYNYPTRALMYSWFNRHLGLGQAEPIVEEQLPLPAVDEYSVWDAEHPAPKTRGEEFERKLTAFLDEQSERQISAAMPRDGAGFDQFRQIVGTAVQTLIGRTPSEVGPIHREKISKVDQRDYLLSKDLIGAVNYGEQLPVISLYPKSDFTGRVIICLADEGKQGMFAADGQPRAEILALVCAGSAVVAPDLFAQGEFVRTKIQPDRNRVVANPREFAGYTYGYNHSLFAQRVHDVLTLVAWIRSDTDRVKEVVLAGLDRMGLVAAAAGAVCGDAIDTVAITGSDFRFAQLTHFREQEFLPGIVKYGDLPALLALNAPKRLIVINSQLEPIPELVRLAYSVSGATVEWKAGQPGSVSLFEAIGKK